MGMESLSSGILPFSVEMARETEEAEGDRLVYEAADEKACSTQSFLAAIKQAKDMSLAAPTNEDKLMYQDIASSWVTCKKICHK